MNRTARHGCCPVSVDTVFMRHEGPGIDKAGGIVKLKRRGIWKEPRRNSRLAKMARTLVVGDVDTANQLARRLVQVEGGSVPRRTVLLADSVEHIAALAERLRSWPIRVNPEYFQEGLTDIQQRSLQRGMARTVTGENLIATPDAMEETRPGTFEAVIWAGGSPGLPPIPWSHLVCRASDPRRLLLVDVRDRHHPRLRRWSCQRRTCYEDAGWLDRSTNPTLARILRFFDQRPRGTGQ